MKVRYGKALNSFTMKKGMDKRISISLMKQFPAFCKERQSHNSTCPICGSLETQVMAEIYGFTYRECGSCQMAFIADMPNEDDLEKVYRSDLYAEHTQKLYGSPDVVEYRLHTVAEPKLEHIAERLTTTKKSWLDIGCGTGEILKAAVDRGFKARGLEANEFERKFGIENYGVEIIDEYINDTTIKNYQDGYGVISMFGVLEHILDPHSIIGNIAQIQSPGDNLVIEVPHHPSISAFSQMSFVDDIDRMMIPPFHLYLYSTRGIQILLEKYGYEVTDAWYFGQDFYEMFTTLGLHVDGLLDSALAEKFSSILNDLQYAIDKNEMSDQIMVIARRKDSNETTANGHP